MTMKVPYHHLDYVLGLKGQGQIYLKSVLQRLMHTPLSFFDCGASYLTQWLLMMCRLQQRFQIRDITLESKVNVKFLTLTFDPKVIPLI